MVGSCDNSNRRPVPDPDKGMDYWFEGQIRRLQLQFNALFSQFKYEYIENGEKKQSRILATMAFRDAQVAAIANQNSENVMKCLPAITTYITDIQYNPGYQQDPFVVEKRTAQELQQDEETGEWLNAPGPEYQIERIMSAPYTVTAKADILTANELQKQMIVEQIMPLVVPSLDLYTSENIWDWSALKVLRLTSFQYSSLSIPVGDSDEIDIASFTFEIPWWLNLPAKLKEPKTIKDIRVSMNNLAGSPIPPNSTPEVGELEEDENDKFLRIVCRIENHQLEVDGRNLTLLSSTGNSTNDENEVYKWTDLFLLLKNNLRNGISQVELNRSSDPSNSKNLIRGTIEWTNEPHILRWTPDVKTLPISTLNPVNAIIDPKKKYPGLGIDINPEIGTRFILTQAQKGESEAWGKMDAGPNDIIEFVGSGWRTVWRADESNTVEIVNLKSSGEQILWTGECWELSIDGVYRPGFWQIKF